MNTRVMFREDVRHIGKERRELANHEGPEEILEMTPNGCVAHTQHASRFGVVPVLSVAVPQQL